MHSAATAQPLPDACRNARLRRGDWRFLLRLAEEPGDADLVALDRAGQVELRRAHAILRPGGMVHCERRLAMPGGVGRARRALERAGFEDVRLHWVWPPPGRASAHFWIPLDAPAAASHLLRLRPSASRWQAVARHLWRLAAAIGALAPLSVTARKPGGDPEPDGEIETLLDGLPEATSSQRSWLLLTGGRRSINKVVGLPFEAGKPAPGLVVKFARVAEAERGLEREAEVLATLAAERPAQPGVPRVLGTGRRVGRLAVAETAIHGIPLLSGLDLATFPRLASTVTEWLLGLAGRSGTRQARARWQARLVAAPLEDFELRFGPVAGTDAVARARALLDGLPDLPLVPEHRDCSPWNVVLTAGGKPALLDWESADPHGLPGLDLAYFLANAAFVLEGALESGHTREAYARLLDPATPTGEVFARCVAQYCDRLGLSSDAFTRLRLLCWIVHSRSDYRHLELDAGRPPDSTALRNSVYLGLLQEDLSRRAAP
jgi:Phosphotransferase enzyme family